MNSPMGLVDAEANRIFSELIIHQSRMKFSGLDLTGEGDCLSLLHPAMLKGLVAYLYNPEQEIQPCLISNLNGIFFKNLDEALEGSRDIQVSDAFPYSMGNWLQNPCEIIFNFELLGAVKLVRSKGEGDPLWTSLLQPFMNYATSPELWGPQGKWLRFHERLLTLFTQTNLLKDGSVPGKYILDPSAASMETHGFIGKSEQESYRLVLPWTFSLTDLKRLEVVMRQEF